jgi:hypothetical protein
MKAFDSAELLSMFSEVPMVRDIGFTNVEIEMFKKYIIFQEFKKKEKLLEIGKEECFFRIIYEGLSREYYEFNNREINTQFATQFNIACSYASYMNGHLSNYCIEAVEPTIVFSIRKEWMDLIMVNGRNFIEFGKKISSAVYGQKSQREMELLNYDALGRLQHFTDDHSALFLRLPQTYIASYLNISPETFSSLKKKLKL